MPPLTACPDSAVLRRLFLGQLAGRRAEEVRGHVAGCQQCQQRFRGVVEEETQGPNTSGRTDGVPPPFPGKTPPDKKPEDIYHGLNPETFAFLSPPQDKGEIGRLSHYRVLRVLGEGGMGVVFQAEDLNLERPVALKVMKPSLAANTVQKQRFTREAKATAALKNDHIVTIYHVGEEKGLPYFAMELLQGMPMDDYMAKGRKPSPLQVLRLGRQVALGLAAAHEKGMIHRDIKPGNLWIEATGGGRIKILDFGLARPVEDTVQITRIGTIVGTPAYMSPEQARGLKIDPRSDLFSLGCVLYRLVTGQTPFHGDTTMAVLTSLAVDHPKPVREGNPDLPPALGDLIHQLLAKDAKDRPASAKAVAQALAAIEKDLSGGPTQTLPLGPVNAKPPPHPSLATVPEAAAPPRPPWRRWLRWIGLGFLGLVVLLILISIINPQGTLEVRIADPKVELTVRHGDQIIAERSTEREFKVPAGEGKVEAFEPGKKLLFSSDFRVERNQHLILDLNSKLEDAREKVKEDKKDDSKDKKDDKKKEDPKKDKDKDKGKDKDKEKDKEKPPKKKPADSRLDEYQQEGVSPDLLKLAAAGTGKVDPSLVAAWQVPKVPGKTPEVNSVLFTRDGALMVVGGRGMPVLLWDLIKESPLPLPGGKPDASQLWLPGDGQILYVAFPSELYWYSLKDKSGAPAIEGKGGDFAWQVSADGKWLAAGTKEGKVYVYHASNHKPYADYPVPVISRGIVFHPREPWLLVHFWPPAGGHFRFFDIKKGLVWDGPDRDPFRVDAKPDFWPAFSPDGALLVLSVPEKQFLHRYDIKDGILIPLPPLGPLGLKFNYAFSPKGDTLAVVSGERGLVLLDPIRGDKKREVPLPYLKIGEPAYPFFSPDGRHLAIAYRDVVFLYRLEKAP